MWSRGSKLPIRAGELYALKSWRRGPICTIGCGLRTVIISSRGGTSTRSCRGGGTSAPGKPGARYSSASGCLHRHPARPKRRIRSRSARRRLRNRVGVTDGPLKQRNGPPPRHHRNSSAPSTRITSMNPSDTEGASNCAATDRIDDSGTRSSSLRSALRFNAISSGVSIHTQRAWVPAERAIVITGSRWTALGSAASKKTQGAKRGMLTLIHEDLPAPWRPQTRYRIRGAPARALVSCTYACSQASVLRSGVHTRPNGVRR